MYIVIFTIFRVMGKREIGELSVLDLVIFIMLAEIAVISIDDTEASMAQALVPMLLLLVLQITLAYISLKYQKFRSLIDGTPTIIIANGKILENEMRKLRYNLNDLLMQLHDKDVFHITDVEFAILETSGSLSVMTKERGEEVERATLPIPFVMDGVIQYENLRILKRSPEWLYDRLAEHGCNNVKEILYCSLEKGKFHIQKKGKNR